MKVNENPENWPIEIVLLFYQMTVWFRWNGGHRGQDNMAIRTRAQNQLIVVLIISHWPYLELYMLQMIFNYRTRAIITRSWFVTVLDYKPRILGPTFLVYVLKRSVILTSLALKNGVKNIQTAGYNGARTVDQVNQVNVSSGFKDLSIKKYSRYIPNVNDHFGQQVLSWGFWCPKTGGPRRLHYSLNNTACWDWNQYTSPPGFQDFQNSRLVSLIWYPNHERDIRWLYR